MVAEKVTVNADFESNVKADYLVTNRQTVGSSAESKGGYSDNDSEEIYNALVNSIINELQMRGAI